MNDLKAIQFNEYGKPEVLKVTDVPEPALKPSGVIVKVKAAGVNFADTMRRYNQYLTHTPLPYILGSEVSGVITEVSPEVKDFKVGDRVFALSSEGGYAEYISLHEEQIIRIPQNIDFDQAAAILLQGLTAYHILKTSGQLTQGEIVLVHAAAGGVGTLAVQLAKLMGAGQVIATSSTSDKLEIARSLGADVAINYTNDNWQDQVMEATGGKGVDIVLEMVGGDVFKKSLQCLAPFGRIVIYGQAGSDPAKINAFALMKQQVSVIGFWLPKIMQRPTLYKESVQDLLNYFDAGKLKIIVGETFPLIEAVKAHKLLETRQTTGKVVLNP